jgi:hypothetical protein
MAAVDQDSSDDWVIAGFDRGTSFLRAHATEANF